jgi:probable HAF family extracellular repeat protein
MRHSKTARRTLAVAAVACLLCFTIAQAKKPDNAGGGGGGKTAPYTLVDLLGIPQGPNGGFDSNARSVSEPDNAGRVFVVGESWADFSRRPVFWEVNGDGSFDVTDLGLPPGADGAAASAVNDLGVITVNTEETSEVDADGNSILPAWVLVPDLPPQELARPAAYARANAVNNFGEIVGSVDPGPDGVLWELDAQGVAGNPVNLGNFRPLDVNDLGTMAGSQGGQPAIAWFDAEGGLQVQELDKLAGFSSGEATSISANGTWVCGYVHAVDGAEAFVWSADTGMIGLGTLGGRESRAAGVNSAGQVVGWTDTGGGRHSKTAFLWQNGTMFELNSLADSGGKTNLVSAEDISEAGDIVGVMHIDRVGSHAFLLIPNAP